MCFLGAYQHVFPLSPATLSTDDPLDIHRSLMIGYLLCVLFLSLFIDVAEMIRMRRLIQPVLGIRSWQLNTARRLPSWRLYSSTTPQLDETTRNPAVAKKKVSKKRVKLPSIASITETEAKTELLALNAEINRHDVLYYEQSEPEISDVAYDKLLQRAEALIGKFHDMKHLITKWHEKRIGAGDRQHHPSSSFSHSTWTNVACDCQILLPTNSLNSYPKPQDDETINLLLSFIPNRCCHWTTRSLKKKLPNLSREQRHWPQLPSCLIQMGQ